MTTLHVSPETLPPLGDLRALGQGSTVYVSRSMQGHPLWSRYVEAITGALSKGADITWTTKGQT